MENKTAKSNSCKKNLIKIEQEFDLIKNGKFVLYRGKRCKILLYQPEKTILKNILPIGESFSGFCKIGGKKIKKILENPTKWPRYIIIHNRYNTAGEEITPQCFFVNPKYLQKWQ